ncbi:P-loop containing nucleoside triphosphate hydrolase protein [Punctularia strigosozonata HHB-11173 SS5]|uniref:P-loop containing nucleoside triphosphate hydrolase protein n=1 Tax=Punctularia strigosozonata (strain HHB-11173) TaxID=741275 RepID=UPI00044164AC|nr:P-loop containing nucleoside triphosphate hydrolase protein [Punctularia strigosozonata HHB-11173 SS5]EIN09491.1 P-loop containing nucleoside triphosphate hydrolase protein [Punctularia strigosozonata HHB-11173 SS5]
MGLTPVNSRLWLDGLLREKCKISAPRPFQLDLGLHLINGRDVLLVIATGQGKTTVLHAPLLAAQARKENGIAFIVIPTKLLGEQHVVAEARGLIGRALNEDTVREASSRGHDLFKEIFEGKGVRVVALSPQMLRSPRVWRYLNNPDVKREVRWFFVDEAHLVNEHAAEWCTEYQALKEMRARLVNSTVWAAVTGTATRQEAAFIAKTLGFQPGAFVDARYSIDRPNIKFIPRFFEHPYSGSHFLDLSSISFLIPQTMSTPAEIPTTLIFAETIDLGYRIMRFLDSLIPHHVPHRSSIIKLYNSMWDRPYRERFMEDIQFGDTLRVGVCTDTCAYGFDAPNIARVVVAGIPTFEKGRPPSFAAMMQKIGRAVRNGADGVAYTFAPPWARIVPESEIKTIQQKEDAVRRSKLDPVMLGWFNPTSSRCPRQTNLTANDEAYSPRNRCCSIHDQEPELSFDTASVLKWKARMEAAITAPLHVIPRSDGTYKPLEAHMKLSLTQMLIEWRIRRWRQIRGTQTGIPSLWLLPTFLVQRLVEKAHICTTYERFETVVEGWTYLMEQGKPLFAFVTAALVGFGAVLDDRLVVESGSTEVIKQDPMVEPRLRVRLLIPSNGRRVDDSSHHLVKPPKRARQQKENRNIVQ